MTKNPVPQSAIDVAAEALRQKFSGHPSEEPADYEDEALAALEAALPAIQEAATQRLAEALFAVDGKHHFHDLDGTPKCLCGFVGSARARTQTEHITAAVLEEYSRE